jgi:hypothetical protein
MGPQPRLDNWIFVFDREKLKKKIYCFILPLVNLIFIVKYKNDL